MKSLGRHVRNRAPQRLVRLLRRAGVAGPLSREAMALARYRLTQEARLSAPPARLAIVGCGVQGQTIGRAVRQLPGWSVSALYDLYPEASARFQARLAPGATTFDSLDALLERAGEWDLLAIATTSDSHVAVARAALDAGARKIFLEKPLATSLHDADALAAMVEAHGARLSVDHTRRWLPSATGLRRLLASEAIGPLRALHFTFGHGGFAMIGTHLFDFARWLTGAEFTRLRACLDAESGADRRGQRFQDPSGRCEAEMTGGLRLHVDLSADLPLRQAYFVLVGERGRIEVDERLGHLRLVGAGGRVWEDGYVGLQALELGVASALLDLQGGQPARCDARDARAALEAAIACHLSAREGGRWVSLPLKGTIRDERFAFA